MQAQNADRDWSSLAVQFAADHPTAAGHFPSDPIIPGALLLAHVLKAIEGGGSRGLPCEIRLVKFLHPVRPGDRVTIRWRRQANGEQQFELHRDGCDGAVVVGILRVPPHERA